MKTKLAVFLVLFAALGGSAFGQGFRFDQTVTQQGTIGTTTNAVVIPASPQIAFCNFPANAVPCTNKATTYTSITLVTPCSTSTQIVLVNTSTCVAAPDAQDNWGVWVSSGTYSYTVTLPGGVNLGPYSVTLGIPTNSFAITNAGVFTNTQMNQYLSSLIGGISANEFHNAGQPGFATEGLTGGVALPSSATVQNANGIGGYCTTLANSNGRTGPNCVAMYGFSRILSTASAGAATWGANFGSFSESGSTGGNVIGGEFDIGVGGTDSFVRGVSVIGDWGHGVLGTVPANTIGYELFAQHGFKWPVGFEVDRGILTANAQGFLCEGQNSTNPTNSCGIAFRGYDGGGTGHQSSVSGDSAGNLVLAPALGTAYSFNNSGGGIGIPGSTSGTNTLAAPAIAGSVTTTLPKAGGNLLATGNGAGNLVQTLRTAGCTTSGGATPFTGPCTTTVTWTNAFADGNYTVTCTANGIGAGVPLLQATTTITGASTIVQTQQATGVNASFTNIECTAIHD